MKFIVLFVTSLATAALGSGEGQPQWQNDAGNTPAHRRLHESYQRRPSVYPNQSVSVAGQNKDNSQKDSSRKGVFDRLGDWFDASGSEVKSAIAIGALDITGLILKKKAAERNNESLNPDDYLSVARNTMESAVRILAASKSEETKLDLIVKTNVAVRRSSRLISKVKAGTAASQHDVEGILEDLVIVVNRITRSSDIVGANPLTSSIRSLISHSSELIALKLNNGLTAEQALSQVHQFLVKVIRQYEI